MKLNQYRTILLDGDGVLWKSNQPIPGINAFFDFLERHKINWALLTNNNSHTRQDYVQKLLKFGIPADEQRVFTSITATIDFLLETYGNNVQLHVVGSEALITMLGEAGFLFTHGEQVPQGPVAAVVAGMDRQINHEKIKIAMRLIKEGASFIATNTDGSFPTPDGINPGTGMVIGALQATSGVEPYVAGKPHPAIFKSALKSLGGSPEGTLMIGDRLETDILGGNQLEMDTAVVLTGVTSREEITQSEIKPNFIFDNIMTLLQALVEVYPS